MVMFANEQQQRVEKIAPSQTPPPPPERYHRSKLRVAVPALETEHFVEDLGELLAPLLQAEPQVQPELCGQSENLGELTVPLLQADQFLQDVGELPLQTLATELQNASQQADTDLTKYLANLGVDVATVEMQPPGSQLADTEALLIDFAVPSSSSTSPPDPTSVIQSSSTHNVSTPQSNTGSSAGNAKEQPLLVPLVDSKHVVEEADMQILRSDDVRNDLGDLAVDGS